jgi:cell division transport system permease protein
VLLKNLQIADSSWNASAPTISLYLKSDTTPAALDAFMQSLQNNPHIDSVHYVSPQEGLTAFEKNTPFSDVIKLLPNNPIPGVITVLPATKDQNPDAVNALFLTLKQAPLVDMAQLDMNWVTRLYDIISIGKKITKGLSLLFGFGVILIIGHTLRASLSNHMNEVQVMRLLGATNAYIRRPLLYRGILYGLLGGGVAWVFIDVLLMQLQHPISQLAQTYRTPFQLQTISFSLGFQVLLVSIVAGFISAWLITTQFLNQPEQMD